MRGSIKQLYPSSDMALKLWEQMNDHGENGTCELTFGCTDPIQAGVMAKYQQVRDLCSVPYPQHRILISTPRPSMYLALYVATPR